MDGAPATAVGNFLLFNIITAPIFGLLGTHHGVIDSGVRCASPLVSLILLHTLRGRSRGGDQLIDSQTETAPEPTGSTASTERRYTPRVSTVMNCGRNGLM